MRNGLSFSEAGKLGYLKAKEKNNERCHKIREAYDSKPKQCVLCHSVLSYENRNKKFCSRSCSASHNNAGNRKWGKPPTLCLICGAKNSSFRRKYCSKECYEKMLMAKLEKEWIEKKKQYEITGKLNYVDYHCRRFLRRYLLEKSGCICSICGLKTWNGKEIPLIVDHIDGNPDNHSKTNVRMICGNCSMQLPTFAGGNRGRGRKYRREEYTKKGYRGRKVMHLTRNKDDEVSIPPVAPDLRDGYSNKESS